MDLYRIPEPKENPIAALVILYKVSKGIEYDDRGWDKIHFGRCTKSAKELLGVCSSFDSAKKCIEELSEKYDSAGLTWTLETIVKNSHEWKQANGGGANVKQARTRFLHRLNEQRSNSATSLEGAIHSAALLGSVRDFGIILPEIGAEDRRGMEIRGGIGERTQPTDLEAKGT